MMMTELSYLFIYLLTMPLIGCEPPNTCYYDVSENSLVAAPGLWFRMEKERPDNDVKAIMAAGVARLNNDKQESRMYQLDKDEEGRVAELEMFQQVSYGINFCVRYRVKVVGCKANAIDDCNPANETSRLCDSYARRSMKDSKPKLALIDGIICD